jgi:uncharacterized repeat protein (TIGR02543 family)
LVVLCSGVRKAVATVIIAALALSAVPGEAYAAQIGGAATFESAAYAEQSSGRTALKFGMSAMSDDKKAARDVVSRVSPASVNTVAAPSDEVTAFADVTTKAAWSKCVIEAPQTAQAGVGFKIRLVGDRQDEKGKVSGETKFVPASWEIKGAPFGSYRSEKPFDAPYESIIGLKNAGTYTVSAKYRAYTFSEEMGWTEDVADFEYIRKVTVRVPLTIIFDTRGGALSARSGQYYTDDKCSVFPSPKRKKYHFIGWYRSRAGETADLVKKNDAVAMLNTSKSATVTLYAHYSKSVKVRFEANGGKVKKKRKKATYVTTYEKRTYGKLPRPTRKGYYFAGWYTKKKGGRYASAHSDVRSAKNVTLYAHWIR